MATNLAAQYVEVAAPPQPRALLRADYVEVLAAPPPGRASTFTEYVEVIAQKLPSANVAAAYVETVTRARDLMVYTDYLEILRSSAGPITQPFIGWGIPI